MPRMREKPGQIWPHCVQCNGSRDSARHSKWGVARAEVTVVGEAIVAVLTCT